MILVRAMYGLKSSVEHFRDIIDEHFHGLGYRPSIYDPDTWM